MFKSIKAGLEVYKKTVKEYSEKWDKINKRVDEERLKYGDYTSGRHYAAGELEWKDRAMFEIDAMEKVLGIDGQDRKTIFDAIDAIDENK